MNIRRSIVAICFSAVAILGFTTNASAKSAKVSFPTIDVSCSVTTFTTTVVNATGAVSMYFTISDHPELGYVPMQNQAGSYKIVAGDIVSASVVLPLPYQGSISFYVGAPSQSGKPASHLTPLTAQAFGTTTSC